MPLLWTTLAQYMPHGACYLWQPELVGLHVVADTLIALAYYSIPVTLLYVVRHRTDLPFPSIFLLFGAFIVACGTTHLIAVWTLWTPQYWISGGIKAITAGVSVYTAIAIIPLVPRALALPSPRALELANQTLAAEVKAREDAEAALLALNQELEARIGDRTQALADANQRQAELLEREQAARAEAENTNRLKDEFLATLSHELRTPLNAILGWAQLLQIRQNFTEHLDTALATIERNGRSLAQMIEDLLDVSRIIRGKFSLEIAPTPLADIVQMAINSLRPAAAAKQLHWSVECDPQVKVMGDAGRLQQVVWNLLSNAVKFTPPGGTLTIQLKSQADTAILTVQDTGQGIEADFLPHLFEHFRQADNGLSRSQSGLGLGLAIVRHLVELHGGTVTAASPGLNQGATFTVQLPGVIAQPPENAIAAPSSRSAIAPSAPARTGRSILMSPDVIAIAASAPNPPTAATADPIVTTPADAAIAPAPLSTSDRPTAAAQSSTQSSWASVLAMDQPLRGTQILLVEDVLESDGVCLNYLMVGLARYGASLRQGAIAEIERLPLQTHPPHLLISDLSRVTSDSRELSQELATRLSPWLSQIPAIALTTYTSPRDIQHILDAGFQRHLAKPVNMTDLFATIITLLCGSAPG